MTENVAIKPKVRNYSFKDSKRLPFDKMTEVNGVRIPSMPGSCYHAIICALAQNKDNFLTWDRITELTEKYMRRFGGPQAWDKFCNKKGVKSPKQRIKDNTHTLTRTGRDCYGYRLHEQGMAIYFFKDGAMLLTGGTFEKKGDNYTVTFPDGRTLQTRYRGTTMTSTEYKRFLDAGYIDASGGVLDIDGIRKARKQMQERPVANFVQTEEKMVNVCLTLADDFDQDTAYRLEELGFKVEAVHGNELVGSAPETALDRIKLDDDVIDVDMSG